MIGLLNSQERWLCEHIAGGNAPWVQRAQALISVDEGASYIDAGEIAGLRASQVKYWVAAFRRRRTDIFPENVMKEIDLSPDASDPKISEEGASADESPGKTKKTKKSRSKKGKDSKKKKRKAKKKKGGNKKKAR